MKYGTKNNKAFTLIELIVVIAIIAILVLLAAPRFLGYTKNANVTAMIQDTKALADASEVYHVENKDWPIIEDSEPVYLGYGGVQYLYPIDNAAIEDSIKNIKGDYSEYGIAVQGKYKGQVFHLNGVEDKDNSIVFGKGITIPRESEHQPEMKPGVNLITNGDLSHRNNDNFKDLTYDESVTYQGSPTLRYVGIFKYIYSDEFIPINHNLTYKYQYKVKSSTEGRRAHGMVASFDIDKERISPRHHMYVEDTLTTLSKDINPGDKKIYLNDTKNWVEDDVFKRIIFWGYADSTGYTYPAETYSRNVTPSDLWNRVDYQENYIELKNGWNGELIPAGTQLSQGADGSVHKYIAGSNFIVPDTWTHKSGTITGLDYSGKNKLNNFPPASKYMKVGWILNGNNTEQVEGTFHLADIDFTIQ